MASKNQCYVDLKFNTNGAIEDSRAEFGWPSDSSAAFKDYESASAPADPVQTFLPMESLHQGFDLLV